MITHFRSGKTKVGSVVKHNFDHSKIKSLELDRSDVATLLSASINMPDRLPQMFRDWLSRFPLEGSAVSSSIMSTLAECSSDEERNRWWDGYTDARGG